ncbi:Cu2+-exporting ATPase [Dysgonomonas sp. PH5-45]|uniref:heavy metal translocating P-type ATPase n=1 Tax=unclassified Dysgonomonas TaxID=2630389 RepID=UPI00247541E2|nr:MULTISPECIES: heavy metal translocating P-type ATPase [unclassified Dysgonomonas]MDH6354013.1 Cu2+-exporting ATPase [Dysgonomonas sp. PH5-45]MDH6386915.1 Cu2+-exporting ATPase [Dysgonomonas sp. PH5-37]
MATKDITKRTFPVQGMSCAGCAANVQKILRSQKGVVGADVNFAGKSALVEYNPAEVSLTQLQHAVRSGGYELIVTEDENVKDRIEESDKRYLKDLKKKTLIASILSACLIILAMTPLMHSTWARYLMWILTTPVLFYCGKQFFVGAYKQAKHRAMNMDTLVAMSTGVAYLFSVFTLLFPRFWTDRGLPAELYFEASAVIVTFILLGRYLEERAKQKTTVSLKKLIGLQPKTATVVKGFLAVPVSIDKIMVGDTILVKSGEKIPVDGIVVDGESYVDESMITGEPVFVPKQKDDKVFAGTINQKGSFRFKAGKVGSETLLSHIIKMVEEAQGSKAPVQKLVDKIAGVFVPVVILIAILSAVLWIVFGGESELMHAFLAFVTVLIIACPCALGLATPTAIMVGIGRGAEQGILIKDAESLERLKNVNVVLLDKTGTLTEGKPRVTAVKWFAEETDERKQILYSIEKSSTHPLADAICSYFGDTMLINTDLSVENRVGAGIIADYEGKEYLVGSKSMFPQTLMTDEAHDWVAKQESAANTLVFFGTKSELIAAIALSDKLKAASADAVKYLQNSGIEVYMLTGDNEATAQAIAQQAGVNHYVAQALPEDKLNFVKQLQSQNKIVAMVGDGINDSAALAQADVSIAMGQGSDVAMDVAAATIVSGDLRKIHTAVRLSKETVATIKQNLFFAFIYNMLAIPIAAGLLYPINGFLLNPMIAGLAMALSSISVVTNSLRLKAKRL